MVAKDTGFAGADTAGQVGGATAGEGLLRLDFLDEVPEGGAARRRLTQKLPGGGHGVGILPTAREVHESPRGVRIDLGAKLQAILVPLETVTADPSAMKAESGVRVRMLAISAP